MQIQTTLKMKRILFYLSLLVLPYGVYGQDTLSISNVEQFVNTPGYTVGHLLYDMPKYQISLMKYNDPLDTDRIVGVMFWDYFANYNTKISNLTKKSVAFMDCQDVNAMIQWIDYVKQQQSNLLTIENFSFVASSGNISLVLQKQYNNKDFCLYVKYNKEDNNSCKALLAVRFNSDSYDFTDLMDFYDQLVAMEKIIKATVK